MIKATKTDGPGDVSQAATGVDVRMDLVATIEVSRKGAEC